MSIDRINPISSWNGQGTKASTATATVAETLDPWKEPEAESKI